jgi:hypothetical protein
VLRSDDPDADPATEPNHGPAPGLDRLPELVAAVSRAGLPVELASNSRSRAPAGPRAGHGAVGVPHRAGSADQQPAARSREARAGRGALCDTRSLDIEVVDDGRGPATTGPGGRGLIGMRERVSMHGGRLEIGARPDGGFRVHAQLGRP